MRTGCKSGAIREDTDREEQRIEPKAQSLQNIKIKTQEKIQQFRKATKIAEQEYGVYMRKDNR